MKFELTLKELPGVGLRCAMTFDPPIDTLDIERELTYVERVAAQLLVVINEITDGQLLHSGSTVQ